MKKIIIIGGFGNGTVAQSTIEDINSYEKKYEILGYLNDNETGIINNYEVLGKIDKKNIEKYLKFNDVDFYYSLISLKLNFNFLDKLLMLQIPPSKLPTLIHPTCVISRHSNIGYGCCIQPFVSIGPNVKIGNHVQIYAQALVGHGAIIENYSYIANNACIGADVHLNEGAYIGTNASTIEFIKIGKWSVVGMGSVVLKDIPDYMKFAGNPAKNIGINK
jgi:acetyltransferase EpsM